MSLFSEISEQPERIKNLLSAQRKNVERIAANGLLLKFRNIKLNMFFLRRGAHRIMRADMQIICSVQ
jgi:hypothetical protein